MLLPRIYTVGDDTFTVVDTTPFNRKRLKAYLKERAQKREEYRRILMLHMDNKYEEELPEAVNEYDMYYELFILLTEGPHEKLDREHFNEKLGEAVLADFLPAAMRTIAQQTGFLPPLDLL